MRRSGNSRHSGFTLVELVAVLLIVAILAVFSTSVFDRRGIDTARFADEVRAQLAFAQKTAVATRRTVTVNVASNSIAMTLCQDAACSATAALTTLRGQPTLVPPSGSSVTLSAVPPSFSFTADGSATNATVSISGDAVRVITVAGATGYVY